MMRARSEVTGEMACLYPMPVLNGKNIHATSSQEAQAEEAQESIGNASRQLLNAGACGPRSEICPRRVAAR